MSQVKLLKSLKSSLKAGGEI